MVDGGSCDRRAALAPAVPKKLENSDDARPRQHQIPTRDKLCLTTSLRSSVKPMLAEFVTAGALRQNLATASTIRRSALHTTSFRRLDINALFRPQHSLVEHPLFQHRIRSLSTHCISYTSQVPKFQLPRSSAGLTRRLQSSALIEQRRLCSYQRSMCRQQLGADAIASGLDVSKGREVLPKNVIPTHYRLTLEPNLETFEFDGQVEIE